MDDASEIKSEVEKVKAWYDLTAKDFDRRYDGLSGEYWYQFEDVVFDSLLSCDGQVVLDAGTGAGRYAMRITSKAKEIHGIDISPSMVSLAKKKSVGIKNLYFEIGDSSVLLSSKSLSHPVTTRIDPENLSQLAGRRCIGDPCIL